MGALPFFLRILTIIYGFALSSIRKIDNTRVKSRNFKLDL